MGRLRSRTVASQQSAAAAAAAAASAGTSSSTVANAISHANNNKDTKDKDAGLAKASLSANSGNPSASSSICNTRCFAFLLSNHTSYQYGVCLSLPRTFRDVSKGVAVSCDYCVCLVTGFPFLGLLFHLLLQFEALGGLDFSGTAGIKISSSCDVKGLTNALTEQLLCSSFIRLLITTFTWSF
jgi:hypothetical protein